MSFLSFTKEELEEIICLIHGESGDLTTQDSVELIKKAQYMIAHIERQEKTVAKFEGWQRQLSEQKNE